jgi:uncharacterized protein (TIRG00374 family)
MFMEDHTVNSARLRRILHISLIAVLTIVFIGLFLWKSDLGHVWGILKRTNPFWFAAGLFINFWALVFRTIRWRILLDRVHPPRFYPTFFANTIGYMLSATLPIRAGDVARPALLARRTDVRFATALGTVLSERVLDLVSILCLFLFFCVLRWNEFRDPVVHGGAVGAGVLLLSMFVLVIGVYFFGDRIRRLHARLGLLLPLRFREPWMKFFDAFAQTLQLAKAPAALAAVLASTAGVWFCLIAQYWFVLWGTDRPLPLDASLFLSGATTIGVAIPTPGGVGGFHKVCQWVLTSYYGFDIDTSVAVAVLLHVVSTVPVLVTGLMLLMREGLSWRDLSRETTADES